MIEGLAVYHGLGPFSLFYDLVLAPRTSIHQDGSRWLGVGDEIMAKSTFIRRKYYLVQFAWYTAYGTKCWSDASVHECRACAEKEGVDLDDTSKEGLETRIERVLSSPKTKEVEGPKVFVKGDGFWNDAWCPTYIRVPHEIRPCTGNHLLQPWSKSSDKRFSPGACVVRSSS